MNHISIGMITSLFWSFWSRLGYHSVLLHSDKGTFHFIPLCISSKKLQSRLLPFNIPCNINGFIVILKHSIRIIHAFQNSHKTRNVTWKVYFFLKRYFSIFVLFFAFLFCFKTGLNFGYPLSFRNFHNRWNRMVVCCKAASSVRLS